jgi:competence protein ComEA
MLKKILAVVTMLYAAATFAAVDVNKASAAELDGMKGVGPAISTRILDERKKGNFKDWTDFIERIRGVGEGSAAKFSAEGLTVNGDAYKGANAMPAKAEPNKEAKPTKADAKPTADEAKAKKAADKQARADAKQAKADEAKAKKEPVASAKPMAAASAAK